MPKVALIETKPSKTNFKYEFDDAFEFEPVRVGFVELGFQIVQRGV